MYSVEVNNITGYLFKAKSKDYEFDIDVKGKGISPPDVLLASLGSCIGVYTRKYLEGAKLEPTGFQIKIKGELCQESPVRFKEIEISIFLKGIDLDERRKHALLEFVRNCPIHNTLEYKPMINIGLI